MNSSIFDKSKWKRATFGDLASEYKETIKQGNNSLKFYVGLDHMDSENLHLSRWGNLSDGVSFSKVFRKGQLLFGRRRAYQKKAVIAPFDGVCSSDILVFEPKLKIIDENLFPFIIQNDRFFDYAMKTSAGSLSPRTKFKDLAAFDLLLPPLDQQKDLAELLWSIEKCQMNTIKLQYFIKKYIEVFSYTHYSKALTNNMLLKEVATVRGGKRLPSGSVYCDKNTNHPYIRVVDIINNSVDSTQLKYISDDIYKKISQYIITDQDIFISIAGTIGLVASIPKSLSGANLTENAARITLTNNRTYLAKYLMYYLNSSLGKRQIELATMSSAQPKLALSRIANFKIPKVTYNEQEKFIVENESLTLLFNEVKHKHDLEDTIRKMLLKYIIN